MPSKMDIHGKSMTEWANEWGITVGSASNWFKRNPNLTLEEMLEKRKTYGTLATYVKDYKKVKDVLDPNHEQYVSKWVRITGKTIDEWAEQWGVSYTTAYNTLSKQYPNHHDYDVETYAKNLTI